MSLYNILFGMNPTSDILLAAIGLRKVDVERFRDVHASEDGSSIEVYTRTGGGNRDDYPNTLMRSLPGWTGSEDDDFDSTYCTDTFVVPAEWRRDVIGLTDIFANGLRKEFCEHLNVTLRRAPTEADVERAASEAEAHKLAQTRHEKANGHTFVPYDDNAMWVALELAEQNGGKLRSCWGILPLQIEIKTNSVQFPNALHERSRGMDRFRVSTIWKIDEEYWAHCVAKFSDKFPVTMAKLKEKVGEYQRRQ